MCINIKVLPKKFATNTLTRTHLYEIYYTVEAQYNEFRHNERPVPITNVILFNIEVASLRKKTSPKCEVFFSLKILNEFRVQNLVRIYL